MLLAVTDANKEEAADAPDICAADTVCPPTTISVVVAHVKPASATILNEDVLPDGSVNNVPDKLPCVTTTPAALLITFAVPRVIVYTRLVRCVIPPITKFVDVDHVKPAAAKTTICVVCAVVPIELCKVPETLPCTHATPENAANICGACKTKVYNIFEGVVEPTTIFVPVAQVKPALAIIS